LNEWTGNTDRQFNSRVDEGTGRQMDRQADKQAENVGAENTKFTGIENVDLLA
jgi:hypothetical protein